MKQTKRTVALLLALLLIFSVVGASAASITFMRGSRGTAIKRIQKALNNGGYAKLAVTGVFDAKTQSAIKRYQKYNHLKVTGTANPATMYRLIGTRYPNNNPVSDDVMELRSTGSAVKKLQSRLRKLGYKQAQADGVFGKATVVAVKQFQKFNDLKVDGRAGKRTQKVLFSDDAIHYFKEHKYKTLKPGDSGDEVAKLQKALKAEGYDVKVTGYYNEKTEKAVRKFQKDNGLKVDGVAGQQTLAALFGK